MAFSPRPPNRGRPPSGPPARPTWVNLPGMENPIPGYASPMRPPSGVYAPSWGQPIHPRPTFGLAPSHSFPPYAMSGGSPDFGPTRSGLSSSSPYLHTPDMFELVHPSPMFRPLHYASPPPGFEGFSSPPPGFSLIHPASMFNHSPHPNVNYIRSPPKGTITFLSSQPIAAGEELNICYSADESRLWFEPAYDTPLLPNGNAFHDVSEELPFPLTPDSSLSSETSTLSVIEPLPQQRPDAEELRLDLLGLGLFGEPEEDRSDRTQRVAEALGSAASQARSRDQRREKYFKKHAVLSSVMRHGEDGSEAVRSYSPPSIPTLNSENLPYPKATELDRILPAPLHSTGRTKRVNLEPVELTDDIIWDDEIIPPAWNKMARIKGPTELREEAMDDDKLSKYGISE